ncbi:hypothetical protein ACF1BQ_017585 [Bradyrhizobium sp. RDT10]
MNQANTMETNSDPKAGADEKHSGVPFLAVPGIFNGLAEQNMIRAKENIEKMKMASGAINDALLQAYSANARALRTTPPKSSSSPAPIPAPPLIFSPICWG